MTHEEIGEFIGASRETVTRTLSILQEPPSGGATGCTLTIPSAWLWRATRAVKVARLFLTL